MPARVAGIRGAHEGACTERVPIEGETQMTRSEIVAAVAAERERQVSAEGYDPAHDDEHDDGELAWAAACYAAPALVLRDDHDAHEIVEGWPWGGERPPRHGKDRVRDLIKAAALCVAEVERLQRAKQEGGR